MKWGLNCECINSQTKSTFIWLCFEGWRSVLSAFACRSLVTRGSMIMHTVMNSLTACRNSSYRFIFLHWDVILYSHSTFKNFSLDRPFAGLFQSGGNLWNRREMPLLDLRTGLWCCSQLQKRQRVRTTPWAVPRWGGRVLRQRWWWRQWCSDKSGCLLIFFSKQLWLLHCICFRKL